MGLLQQLFDLALGLYSAAVKNRDAVTHILDVGEQVAAKQDGFTSFCKFEEKVFYLPGSDRVKAGSRLIENQQVGVVYECLGKADSAGHTFGERANLSVGDRL